MSDILTLKYRPVTFSDVVGQKHIHPILRAMVKSGSMPPAMIFGGSRGTGKTTCARILAAALNCEVRRTLHASTTWDGTYRDDTDPRAKALFEAAVGGDACGQCPSCRSVQKTNSLSVIEVDAASNGGIEEVRKIRDLATYSHGGEWRVVLLDEAHSMTKEAFNALLKTLEEPPPNTVFVLITTEVDKILETVRSRSMLFEFRRITPVDVANRLRHIAQAEGIEVADDLVQEIATRVQGGMRDAVMLLDQINKIGIQDAEGFREQFGIRDVSEALFTAAVNADHAAGSQLIDEQYRRTGDVTEMVTNLTLLVRDLLVLRSGGVPDQTRDKIEARKPLVEQVDERGLVNVVKVLWDLKTRIRSFEQDQRAGMEMAFVLITEALRVREAPVQAVRGRQEPSQPQEEPRVTLDRLREVLAS